MKISNVSGTVKLSNNYEMPYLGLGVFQAENGNEVEESVKYALNYGYRHIDTAAVYGNEEGVGNAVKNHSITREKVFITSKLWNSDQGYDSTFKAFQNSLNKLQTDYLDLYLIHWPVKGKFIESWKAMEEIYHSGKAKAIGVSNFHIHHLENLFSSAEIKPMVNQVEFHPNLIQKDLLEFCHNNEIQYEAWSPLMKGQVLDVPELIEIAEKYNKNPVQVVLRWNLQKGVVTIPKSVNKNRIESNADIFDFELDGSDVEVIDSLDKNKRIGPDPDNFDF